MLLGLVVFVIGAIKLGSNLTSLFPDLQEIGFGVLLVYIGGGLFSIGFFASLLLLTAQTVVEGVAKALRSSLGSGLQSAGVDRPLMRESAASSPVARRTSSTPRQEAPAFKDQSDEAQYLRSPEAWAQRNLSSSNYEWWTEMGKPNLMRWVQEGRPDFKEWIKANKA